MSATGVLDHPADTGVISVLELGACRPDAEALHRATRRLHRKAMVIAGLALASYLGLMFFAHGPLVALPLAAVLVVALIATGTCVMHDANHGAFGPSARLNRTVAFSADLLGASSWLWRNKHNAIHHGNTNVVGVDTDIEQMPFARLAPAQPWRPWHKYQHVYIWALYGFLTAQWVLFSDFACLVSRRIGSQPLHRRPRRRDVAYLLAGKVVHLAWAVALPLMFHRWWVVIAFYFGCSWLVGFVLAVFFQVAHCVDIVEFADEQAPRRGNDFVTHQLRTTANVDCRSSFLGRPVAWMMGGLHHQIEHHLAPGMPHSAYGAMGEQVRELCVTRGIEYRVHPGFWAALASHARWLRQMGRGVEPG
jgi:linoleoyl-CoA desaturase